MRCGAVADRAQGNPIDRSVAQSAVTVVRPGAPSLGGVTMAQPWPTPSGSAVRNLASAAGFGSTLVSATRPPTTAWAVAAVRYCSPSCEVHSCVCPASRSTKVAGATTRKVERAWYCKWRPPASIPASPSRRPTAAPGPPSAAVTVATTAGKHAVATAEPRTKASVRAGPLLRKAGPNAAMSRPTKNSPAQVVGTGSAHSATVARRRAKGEGQATASRARTAAASPTIGSRRRSAEGDLSPVT